MEKLNVTASIETTVGNVSEKLSTTLPVGDGRTIDDAAKHAWKITLEQRQQVSEEPAPTEPAEPESAPAMRADGGRDPI